MKLSQLASDLSELMELESPQVEPRLVEPVKRLLDRALREEQAGHRTVVSQLLNEAAYYVSDAWPYSSKVGAEILALAQSRTNM